MSAVSTASPARQRAKTEDDHGVYGSASEAIRRSGLGRRRMQTLAAAGVIRVLARPGQALLYHLDDACRVAREASEAR